MDKKEYDKKRHLLNREANIKRATEWNRKNKQRRKEIKDKWRANNRDRTNFLTRRYHYRRKHNAGSATFEQVMDLFKMFPICPYCNKNKSVSIDHMIPLSKGGTNDIDNLLPVCVSCNSQKRDKTIKEFRPILVMMWERMADNL